MKKLVENLMAVLFTIVFFSVFYLGFTALLKYTFPTTEYQYAGIFNVDKCQVTINPDVCYFKESKGGQDEAYSIYCKK